jgi:acyl dehydratase
MRYRLQVSYGKCCNGAYYYRCGEPRRLSTTNMKEVGETATMAISYSQEQVDQFSEITGDHNPLHHDATYAASTSFKRPVIHGMLSVSVFSRYFGTQWPGLGTLFLKQTLDFKRPMYPSENYTAVFTLLEWQQDKHQVRVKTDIINTADGKICVTGEALVKHPTVL